MPQVNFIKEVEKLNLEIICLNLTCEYLSINKQSIFYVALELIQQGVSNVIKRNQDITLY